MPRDLEPRLLSNVQPATTDDPPNANKQHNANTSTTAKSTSKAGTFLSLASSKSSGLGSCSTSPQILTSFVVGG